MQTIQPSDLDLSTAITFNTNREYSDSGQQIYACRTLDNTLTIMADISRGLQYAYECPCTQQSIMHAYDNNKHTPAYVQWQVSTTLIQHFDPK